MVDIPDKPTEDDTSRDGAFSYAAEWHAFTHGFYDGMRSIKPVAQKLPDDRDVQKEPHYYKGGFIISTILQFILVYGAYEVTL